MAKLTTLTDEEYARLHAPFKSDPETRERNT
jgi:hypothetical protein